jgi:hypothetical protein
MVFLLIWKIWLKASGRGGMNSCARLERYCYFNLVVNYVFYLDTALWMQIVIPVVFKLDKWKLEVL